VLRPFSKANVISTSLFPITLLDFFGSQLEMEAVLDIVCGGFLVGG
jgi:hypothetical protein